jgi:hypothetical protein
LPGKLTRSQVSLIVLGVIRKMESNDSVQEATRFWEDLRVDAVTKRTYYAPIRAGIEAAGSGILGLTPADFERPETVRGLVDLVHRHQIARGAVV